MTDFHWAWGLTKQATPHQENYITCGMCGTTLLMQTTLSHTPTNNGGYIILVVATQAPKSIALGFAPCLLESTQEVAMMEIMPNK